MADNSTNDELVSQFMAFTGSSDPSRAASYLEMSGGDLQTAVGLYMEHEQTPSAGIAGGAGASSGDAFGAGGLLGDEDVVRAPDETRRMQLMDDRMMHHHHMIDPSMHLMNAMMEEQFASAFEERPRSSSSGRIDPRGAVNAAAAAETKTGDEDEDDDQDYNYDDDDEDENAGGGNDNDASTGGVARLSDMFAAPTHLIHSTGGFQGSRAAAKDAKRWLLVNIQRDAEFASHALNRDVWRDELVENLVRAGFIFWQQVCQFCQSVRLREILSSHFFASLFLIFSLIRQQKDEPMLSDTKSLIFLILGLLTLVQGASYGGKKAGRKKIQSPPKLLRRWPWTFVLETRLIDHPKLLVPVDPAVAALARPRVHQ